MPNSIDINLSGYINRNPSDIIFKELGFRKTNEKLVSAASNTWCKVQDSIEGLHTTIYASWRRTKKDLHLTDSVIKFDASDYMRGATNGYLMFQIGNSMFGQSDKTDLKWWMHEQLINRDRIDPSQKRYLYLPFCAYTPVPAKGDLKLFARRINIMTEETLTMNKWLESRMQNIYLSTNDPIIIDLRPVDYADIQKAMTQKGFSMHCVYLWLKTLYESSNTTITIDAELTYNCHERLPYVNLELVRRGMAADEERWALGEKIGRFSMEDFLNSELDIRY